jgi:hypothetical protein
MTRFKIETPVPKVTTDIGPAHFQQGVAEVDDTTPGVPGVLAYCRHNGYTVTDLTPIDEDPADGVGDDDGDPLTPPPGNAKVGVWRAHVVALGNGRVTADQVAGLNRDQLKELAAQLKEGPQA